MLIEVAFFYTYTLILQSDFFWFSLYICDAYRRETTTRCFRFACTGGASRYKRVRFHRVKVYGITQKAYCVNRINDRCGKWYKSIEARIYIIRIDWSPLRISVVIYISRQIRIWHIVCKIKALANKTSFHRYWWYRWDCFTKLYICLYTMNDDLEKFKYALNSNIA